jgi:uncharacterized delta-60 repeat protein
VIVTAQAVGTIPALASAGDLDTSFSQDGLLLRRDIPGGIYSLATQPDGKVVAAGVGSAPDGANTMVLARFNPDGSLDHTFSGDGVKSTRFAGSGYAWSVGLLPDGDIVAGGEGSPPQGGPTNFLIVRYHTDGTLDQGFSGDGKAHTRFGTQSSAMIDTHWPVRSTDDTYEVGVAYYREIARGQIRGDTTGRLKLIFHRETREILGVHIIGEGASELLHIGQAVMILKGTIDYFVETVFNYPTLAECYKQAAFNGINKLMRF